MKAKILGALAMISAFGLAAQVVGGCGRSNRTRPPPPSEISIAAPPLDTSMPSAEKLVAQLRSSVHAKLDCSDCHAPKQGSRDIGKGQCTSCHEKEAKAYAQTVHAQAVKDKHEQAADCDDCHGMHDVRKVNDPESKVAPRNTPRTCGKCHENPDVAKKLGISEPLAARHYVESIHGRSLLGLGLLVAPSCADCHGKAHRLFRAKDPRSSVNRFNVAGTCGHCHAGPRDAYAKGVHAKALGEEAASGKTPEDETKRAPTCPTCHSAHSIVEAGPKFLLAEDRICGHCHADRLKRYLETYHGRAHDLGDPDVAACHNCHGRHDIWPSSDAASMLSSARRADTCRTCHVSASDKFAGYMAHADAHDKQHYPKLYWTFMSMTALLVGVFGFFGIHCLLWLVRGLVLRAKDPKGFREAKRKRLEEQGARLYTRFRPIDRFVHFLVIVSFTLLVMTGMPLKFHSSRWAHSFFDAIGGAAVAASVHRFAAVVTLLYFVLHIGSLLVLVRRHRDDYRDDKGRFSTRRFLKLIFGPDSPFPRWQDAKDIVAHFKWFFGRGPRPEFDRFTYWEKFDYMAVFWGVTVIGLSGLVMWYPELFTRFMPGWGINIAHIVHSDEALLAAGFIFTVHFFNSHFRPEKFPYDEVMFSGYFTEEELQHEHPAQYARMKKAGELDEYKRLGEWPKWRLIVNVFGATAITLGVILAVAIFWALLH
jgi:cytochrome b subunit of formate dehydrogenase